MWGSPTSAVTRVLFKTAYTNHPSQQSLQFLTKIIPDLYNTLKFLFQHPSHFLPAHDTDSEKMDKNCLTLFPNTYRPPYTSCHHSLLSVLK